MRRGVRWGMGGEWRMKSGRRGWSRGLDVFFWALAGFWNLIDDRSWISLDTRVTLDIECNLTGSILARFDLHFPNLKIVLV
jgi:hypothetical protein